ncbi:MAG: HEPN domain-containing protein [Candidatus Bathyarchaeia archaeon]
MLKKPSKGGNYAFTIRQSQEAVELALKGALRLMVIEPPKWHDVGPVIKRHRNLFPEWFRVRIDEIASISRRLRREGSRVYMVMKRLEPLPTSYIA